MSFEAIAAIAENVSMFALLVGTVIMFLAMRKLGESTIRAIITYLFLGTLTLTFVSLYLNMGAESHGVADESFDVWWHILFYPAFIFYFMGVRLLARLSSGAAGLETTVQKRKWIVGIVVIALVFVIPSSLESLMSQYTASAFNTVFGLHHFISFVLAGLVASYLIAMRGKLGQIGQAIATPFTIAVAAFSIQHLWELTTESWKLIDITTETIEGVEQIFMITAGIGIIWSAVKLKKFADNF